MPLRFLGQLLEPPPAILVRLADTINGVEGELRAHVVEHGHSPRHRFPGQA